MTEYDVEFRVTFTYRHFENLYAKDHDEAWEMAENILEAGGPALELERDSINEMELDDVEVFHIREINE